MGKKIKAAIVTSVVTAALTVGAVSPASAWGNKFFNSDNCSGYSTSETSTGQAGANTVRFSGTGTVIVGFRGVSHQYINKTSSASSTVTRSYIDQVAVDAYNVWGATHSCQGKTATT